MKVADLILSEDKGLNAAWIQYLHLRSRQIGKIWEGVLQVMIAISASEITSLKTIKRTVISNIESSWSKLRILKIVYTYSSYTYTSYV